MRPLKRIPTAKNATATLKTRDKVTIQLAQMMESGLGAIDNVWFPGETWVDQDVDGALNAQNDRAYYPQWVKKDEVAGELMKPRKQRAPGIMAHLTVSPHGGGTVLKPYFAPHGTTIAAQYYRGMLEGDILRHLDVEMGGAPYWFQQDLDSPRAAKITKGLFDKEPRAKLLPWTPAGADFSPLDVFVNPSLKEELREKDIGALAKLQLETSLAIDRLSKDAAWRAKLVATCRAFQKRATWVATDRSARRT